MRKFGIRSFCNGDDSISILNQCKTDRGDSCMAIPSLVSSPYFDNAIAESPTTVEEMIIQLGLEEEIARKAKLNDYGEMQRRMSCVNNYDLLRSARNTLNQYPRFSLDGKDAMNRTSTSFCNLAPVSTASRKSSFCKHGVRGRNYKNGFDYELEKTLGLPPTLAGESVVWSKPGVVAKLMGLEAMPVPISCNPSKERLSNIIKNQNLRRAERHEMERRRLADGNGRGGIKRGKMGFCPTTGYCVTKPVTVEPANNYAGWPTQHFM